jgi:Putative beta-lactamase-inhibitor-like, PepSY-like
MKKIMIILSACLLISILGYSQKTNVDKVPAPVKEAFAKKYPAATNVKYEMEKKDFEVTFSDKGVEMSANFDATGKWLETETEMKAADLPKEVSVSVGKNFAGFKISEVAKTETPDKGLIYEMDLKKDKEAYEVQFSQKGEILKKVVLKKEKEDDEKK